MLDTKTYAAGIANLRELLRLIGRAEFRAYGYWKQLRNYRCAMRGGRV